MLFIRVEDFYQKAAGAVRLSREEEKACGARMAAGDSEAREKILLNYFPMIAAIMKRQPEEMQTLELVYRCMHSLEKAADGFDFTQDRERFSHRLSWWLRQTIVRYMADNREARCIN